MGCHMYRDSIWGGGTFNTGYLGGWTGMGCHMYRDSIWGGGTFNTGYLGGWTGMGCHMYRDSIWGGAPLTLVTWGDGQVWGATCIEKYLFTTHR